MTSTLRYLFIVAKRDWHRTPGKSTEGAVPLGLTMVNTLFYLEVKVNGVQITFERIIIIFSICMSWRVW